MKTKLKKTVLIMSLFLSPFLCLGSAFASTLNDVINLVNEEYAAGHMNDSSYDDLMLPLKDAKSPTNAADYTADLETFRVLVMAASGSTIQSDAAQKILSAAAGL